MLNCGIFLSFFPFGLNATSGAMSAGENIRVVARFRPASARETAAQSAEAFRFGEDGRTVSLASDEAGSSFTFDSVLSPDATQADTYTHVSSIVDAMLQGYNGTILAYGQTGSGKTHSVMGSAADAGLLPRAVKHVSAPSGRWPPTLRRSTCPRTAGGSMLSMARVSAFSRRAPGSVRAAGAHGDAMRARVARGTVNIISSPSGFQVFAKLCADASGAEFLISCSYLEIYKEVRIERLAVERERARNLEPSGAQCLARPRFEPYPPGAHRWCVTSSSPLAPTRGPAASRSARPTAKGSTSMS